MFSKESKYLEHELGVARKDVSAWAARPLSFESEGKANLGAFCCRLRGWAPPPPATPVLPLTHCTLHPAPFLPHPCCLA